MSDNGFRIKRMFVFTLLAVVVTAAMLIATTFGIQVHKKDLQSQSDPKALGAAIDYAVKSRIGDLAKLTEEAAKCSAIAEELKNRAVSANDVASGCNACVEKLTDVLSCEEKRKSLKQQYDICSSARDQALEEKKTAEEKLKKLKEKPDEREAAGGGTSELPSCSDYFSRQENFNAYKTSNKNVGHHSCFNEKGYCNQVLAPTAMKVILASRKTLLGHICGATAEANIGNYCRPLGGAFANIKSNEYKGCVSGCMECLSELAMDIGGLCTLSDE